MGTGRGWAGRGEQAVRAPPPVFAFPLLSGGVSASLRAYPSPGASCLLPLWLCCYKWGSNVFPAGAGLDNCSGQVYGGEVRSARCLSAPPWKWVCRWAGKQVARRAAWEKGCFLVVGKRGADLGERSGISHPWKDASCEVWGSGVLACTGSTQWVFGEAHWDVKVHLWSFRLCTLLTKELGGGKGDKGAICRLLISITGVSQQSAETTEAGWAYQKLYEIVGFDQHLIAHRLLGSVSLALSPVPKEAGGCRSWTRAPAADCVCLSGGLMAREDVCKCPR